MSKKIIIISGDPNSVNSEIIYKVWKKLNKNLKKKIEPMKSYSTELKKFPHPRSLKNVEKEKKSTESQSLERGQKWQIEIVLTNTGTVSLGTLSLDKY